MKRGILEGLTPFGPQSVVIVYIVPPSGGLLSGFIYSRGLVVGLGLVFGFALAKARRLLLVQATNNQPW